jgi:large subunit ribosomal protein L32
MAVPKKKQSHSRTAKRRAQHKINTPALNACPRCHSPRRPHRVCPVCGTYAGREVVGTVPHEHEHEDE